MQILRILGLVSADYDSEKYAITELGEKMLEQVFGNAPNYNLLRELFMGIVSSSEAYNHNCDLNFECYIGYLICYAFAKLDYIISTSELPPITTYSWGDRDLYVSEVKKYRSIGKPFPKDHEHAPRTQQGKPQKNPSNLTRSINQILRVCGIINEKPTRINGINYYTCTEDGKKYVDEVTRLVERGKYTFIHPAKFRRENLVRQKQLCSDGLAALYNRSGIDNSDSSNVVFSPYQLLPEASVSWFLGKTIRPHPIASNARVDVINRQITALDLRVRAKYAETTGEAIKALAAHEQLIQDILQAKDRGDNKDVFTESLIESYKDADKSRFYPFVHVLLRIMGLDCRGEVGRFDGYSLLNEHIIPTEIKSRTETPCYNLKGLRQAVENKICSYNPSLSDDLNYSSLVVGFEQPSSLDDVMHFIESANEKFRISIIATDINTLVRICMRIVWDNMSVDLEDFCKKYGVISD